MWHTLWPNAVFHLAKCCIYLPIQSLSQMRAHQADSCMLAIMAAGTMAPGMPPTNAVDLKNTDINTSLMRISLVSGSNICRPWTGAINAWCSPSEAGIELVKVKADTLSTTMLPDLVCGLYKPTCMERVMAVTASSCHGQLDKG